MGKQVIILSALFFCFQLGAQTRFKFIYFQPMTVGSIGGACSPAGVALGVDSTNGLLWCNLSGVWAAVGVGGGSSPPFSDALNLFANASDATKLGKFNLSNITTGTTITWTWQNQSMTVAGINVPQTWTATQTHSANILPSGGTANIGLFTLPFNSIYGTNLYGEQVAIYDYFTNTGWTWFYSSAPGQITLLNHNGSNFATFSDSGANTATWYGAHLPSADNSSSEYLGSGGARWYGLNGCAIASVSANNVFAGPSSGSATTPCFRTLVAADIPSLSGTYLPLAGGTMTGSILASTTGVNLGSSGNPFGNLFVGNVVNETATTYDIGTSTNPFRALYLSNPKVGEIDQYAATNYSNSPWRLIPDTTSSWEIDDPSGTNQFFINPGGGYSGVSLNFVPLSTNTLGTVTSPWPNAILTKINGATAPTTGFLDSQNGYKKTMEGSNQFNGAATSTYTTTVSFTPDFCFATVDNGGASTTETVSAGLVSGQCAFVSSVPASTSFIFWHVTGH